MLGVSAGRRAPWILTLGRFLVRGDYRGGTRLLRVASRLGLLDRTVRYPLGGGIEVDVPLSRPSTQWDDTDVELYEARFIDMFAEVARSLPRPVHLIDCGADIGLFALKIAARCPFLAGITAFEPNSAAFPYLEANLRRLPMGAEARKEGAGNFRGRGALRSPAHDADDHARYVVPVETGGDFDVTRIDDLALPADRAVLLKIDTEGTEHEIVRGAFETLKRAPAFAVGFEAHEAVVRRTGVDPQEIFTLLRSIRPCTVELAERPDIRIDPMRPFVDQVDSSWHVFNVVCVAK